MQLSASASRCPAARAVPPHYLIARPYAAVLNCSVQKPRVRPSGASVAAALQSLRVPQSRCATRPPLMSPVDTRLNIANLGLDRLDGQVVLDDLQGQAQGLQADPLLAELERPAAPAPTVDDGETVLAMPAWPSDAPKTLPDYPSLRSFSSGQDAVDDGEVITAGLDQVDVIAAVLSAGQV